METWKLLVTSELLKQAFVSMKFGNLSPFKFPFAILRKLGVWIDGSSSWLYCIYGLLSHLFLIVGFIILHTVHFYQMMEQNKIEEVADVLNVLFTGVGVVFKTTWFIIKIKKIKVMQQNINELLKFNLFKVVEKREKVQKRVNYLRKGMKFYFSSGIVAVTAAIIQFFVKSKNKRLPYETWFYWDYKNNDVLLWSLAFYQYGVSIFGFCISYSVDVIIIIFMVLLTSAFEELSTEILFTENILSSPDNCKLENYIKYHIKIKKFAEKISRDLSFPFFLQTFSSSIFLCTSIFLLSMVIWYSNLNLFNHSIWFQQISIHDDPVFFLRTLSYGVNILVQIYLPCYFGNELFLASENISTNLFHSKLMVLGDGIKETAKSYDQKPMKSAQFMEKSLKRHHTALKVFFDNTKKATTIKASGLIIIDLQTFQSICNFSYSLYAVLNKVNQKWTSYYFFT